jgi:hypothetical protein
VYPPSCATITNKMWSRITPITKDVGCKIGHDQKKEGGVEFTLFPANGGQGPAAMTNNQQETVDQIQADNIIKRSWVSTNRKK